MLCSYLFVCLQAVFACLGVGDRASNSTRLNFGFPEEIKLEVRTKNSQRRATEYVNQQTPKTHDVYTVNRTKHINGRVTLLSIESPQHFHKRNETRGSTYFSLELVDLTLTYINEVCINVV